MTNLRFITVVVLMMSLFASDEIDKLTQFKMSYNESVVIESATVVDLPFNVSTPEINLNTASTFESNNTNKDLVEHIQLLR